MRHQIIQRNKFCLNKYLLIENQVQEEETMWKVYKLFNLFPPRLPFSFFCALLWGLYLFPSPMVAWGLYPLPSSMFVTDYLLSLLVFLSYALSFVHWVVYYPFLVASFAINIGILLTGVLTFWGGLIRLCSDLAMPVLLVLIFSVILGFFSLWLWVLCSMVTECWLTILYILRVLSFNYASQFLIWGSNDCCFNFGCLRWYLIIAQKLFTTF